MAAPQQGGGGSSDNSMSILWGVAAVFSGLAVVWYAFKSYIINAYFSIKLFELKLLSIFGAARFEELRYSILAAMTDPSKISFDQILNLGAGVGDWLRFPIIILLFVLAFVVYLGNSTRIFKRNYSMSELARLEKDNWPQIAPVINLGLLKKDIDKGPWAMAMTPMQFCKKNKLLEEVKPQRREGISRKEWNKITVVLKRGEVNKLFSLQLGSLWTGVDKLPPHTKALFAAFAARINADTKPAADLLIQLSASSVTKFNFTGVDELLKKHLNTKLIQKIVTSHAYVLTVMASMLESARDDGVQGSADFLWVKPMDRRLWYTLNTVGRQTPFVEVAGIFSHWTAEKEVGHKLLVPFIDEATKALEVALAEVIYRPDEE